MRGQHTTDSLIPWEHCQSLRRIRRALGWTQLDLSLRLGLSTKTIYNIEHCVLQARRAYVQEIVETFLSRHSKINEA